MAIAHSKVTAQGQISVPAKVRRKLAIGPGSVLEWSEEGDQIVVRRAGRFSSEDVHTALFAKASRAASPPSLGDLKAGIPNFLKKKHARR